MDSELDDDVLEFAHRMFDLARDGDASTLAANLSAGLPANLTNHTGDTLLMLADYHDHPGAVRVLLDAIADTGRINDRGQTALGAAVFRRSSQVVALLLEARPDPALGSPSAVDVARFFDLPEMLAQLAG